jgi:hypothetical protein
MHCKEPTMTNRLDTLIQRTTALAMAAVVTLAMMGAIDSLAARDIVSDSLLAAHAAAAHVA